MRNLEMNKQSRHATVEERCVTQPVKKEVMRIKELSIRGLFVDPMENSSELIERQ